MTQVDIDDELYNQIINYLKTNSIEYPSIKNYVNRAVLDKIKKDMGDGRIE